MQTCRFPRFPAALIVAVSLLAGACATPDSTQKDAPDEQSSAGQRSEQSQCPTERNYGDPNAPNMLVFESKMGTRTLYFDEVVAAVDRTRRSGIPGLWVRFPGFGENLPFSFVMAPLDETRQGKVNTGYFKDGVQIDCMRFDFEANLDGRMRLDKFAKPTAKRGKVAANFEFRSKKVAGLELHGRLQTDDLREVVYTPVINKDAEIRVSPDTDVPSLEAGDARMIFDQGADRLYVRLLNTSGKVLTYIVAKDFDGEPGVYFGPPNTLTGLRESIVVVEDFGPDTYRIVEWHVDPDRYPATPPPASELPKLGKVISRIEVAKMVKFPRLDPLALPAASGNELAADHR